MTGCLNPLVLTHFVISANTSLTSQQLDNVTERCDICICCCLADHVTCGFVVFGQLVFRGYAKDWVCESGWSC